MCNCILSSNHGNFTFSGIMSKFRGFSRSSSYAKLSKYCLLGRMAHVSCSHHFIFYINFRLYFEYCSINNILAKNVNKSINCKTKLIRLGNFYSQQDDLSVRVQFYSILEHMDLLHNAVCTFRMAMDFLQCRTTFLQQECVKVF